MSVSYIDPVAECLVQAKKYNLSFLKNPKRLHIQYKLDIVLV